MPCDHGHVVPNPDGSLARCGGPAICPECRADAATPEGRLALIARAHHDAHREWTSANCTGAGHPTGRAPAGPLEIREYVAFNGRLHRESMARAGAAGATSKQWNRAREDAELAAFLAHNGQVGTPIAPGPIPPPCPSGGGSTGR